MERKLNISWEEPAEPNDYTLKYTVTITDISTGTELSRTVVLDIHRYTILTKTLGMICEDMSTSYSMPHMLRFILTSFREGNSLQCDCVCY